MKALRFLALLGMIIGVVSLTSLNFSEETTTAASGLN